MSVVRTRDQSPRLARPIVPSRPPQAGGPGGLSPKDVLRIILKRKWLIIGVWLGVIALVMGATTVWWFRAPLYSARALLKITPTERILTELGATVYGKDIIERHKRDQIPLIRYDEVLEAAVKDDRITKTDWYQDHRKRAVQALDDAIGVTNRPNTTYVEVTMTSMRKDEVANIVNAVADHAVSFSEMRAHAVHDRDLTILNAQRVLWHKKLVKGRGDLAREMATQGIPGQPQRTTELTNRIRSLSERLALAEDAKALAEAELKHWQQLGNETESDFQIQRMLDMDPMLRGMDAQIYDYNTRLSNIRTTGGPDHRLVMQVNALLEASQQQREDRRQELIETQTEAITQIRMREMAIATSQSLQLREALTQAKAEAWSLEVARGAIYGLENEVAKAQARVAELDKAISDRELYIRESREKGGAVGQIKIWAHATEPRVPTYPQWGIMTAIGILLGLVLGFGLAFLLELADISIKGPADIVRRFDLPLLGVVPHADDLDEDIEDIRRVVLTAPHSPAAEAFRHIRTNLLFSGPAHQRQSLLVTSPAPQDGRTTVVLNLATSMAQAGRRVLVVDANFRQPALAEIFPAAATAGLSSALVGQAAWRDVVSPTDVPNLSVIASGPLPPNPAELLGSDACRQLISEMAAEYDQVILDGSPLMVVSDASVLSTQVDGTILVVRAGVTSAGLVNRATDQLTRIGAHVLGVVLQGIRTTAGGYLRKNYRTFYEYQQKPLP